MNNTREKFETVTDEMTDLFTKKNADYGDSVFETMDEFGMTATAIRLNDKVKRLKTLTKQEAKVKDESMRDTLLDIANYAVTGLMWLDEKERNT